MTYNHNLVTTPRSSSNESNKNQYSDRLRKSIRQPCFSRHLHWSPLRCGVKIQPLCSYSWYSPWPWGVHVDRVVFRSDNYAFVSVNRGQWRQPDVIYSDGWQYILFCNFGCTWRVSSSQFHPVENHAVCSAQESELDKWKRFVFWVMSRWPGHWLSLTPSTL